MKNIGVFTIFVIVLLFSSNALGSSPPPKKYTPVSRPHTMKEKALDMGVMFVALWAGYAATQPDVVAKISWESWEQNALVRGAVLYDRNLWVINFVGHPYVGSEYYLYFRSRGYAPKWAFIGCMATSTVFEAAVESTSQPFSTNDFVVTPLTGILIGYGREKAAYRLLNTNSKFNRFFGHVLYPETLFRFFEKAEIMPAVSPDGKATGLMFVATF